MVDMSGTHTEMLDIYLLNAYSIIEISCFLQDDKTYDIKDLV